MQSSTNWFFQQAQNEPILSRLEVFLAIEWIKFIHKILSYYILSEKEERYFLWV